jgi:hypothetical protein
VPVSELPAVRAAAAAVTVAAVVRARKQHDTVSYSAAADCGSVPSSMQAFLESLGLYIHIDDYTTTAQVR